MENTVSDKHIDWSKKFELGVHEIDLQHHYFIDLINRMVDELSCDDANYHERLIRELNAYVKFHFVSEENLMYRAGYPGIEEHRQHHFDLIQELNSKQINVSEAGSHPEEVIEFLTSWFMHHTIIEDMKFSDFLKSSASDKMEQTAAQKSAEDLMTVLIVEDQESNAILLGKLVEKAGYQHRYAENGKMALDMLHEGLRPDLILLDIVMPVMNGYEFLDACHSDQDLRTIPVIMLTALDDASDVLKAVKKGATDYCTKPIDPNDLLTTIKRVLA